MEILAPSLAEYQDKYQHIKFERDDDGILEMTLHTGGDSLIWTARVHDELGYAFTDVSTDRENRVVVLTGSGDSFCAEIDFTTFGLATPLDWSHIAFEGRRLVRNLLDIEVPIVAAINGPATIHPEVPILSDITIASTTVVFQDGPHFPSGIVPGDGAQFIWPHLLGLNRGRYFLLTGQELDAQASLELGVVNEVLPQDQVLDRARELARGIASKTDLAIRYTRILMKRELDRLVHEQQGLGFPHTSLAAIDMMAAQSNS